MLHLSPLSPPDGQSARPTAVLRAIGWFLPAVPGDRVALLRSRLFVVLSFLVTANMGLFAVLHTLHHLPGADGTNIGVMLAIAAVNAVLPFALRAGVPLRVLTPVFVVVLQVGVVVLACFDLGMASGAVFWLVITPLGAAILSGARLGWAAAALSVGGAAGMYAATVVGWTFPTGLPPAMSDLHHIINFVCCAASVAALAALYEGPMVSALRELAAQLRETNDQLERELAERRRAQGRAEAASRAKDTLLTTMSHEFRTPLAAILGVTDLLVAETEGPHRAFLREIDANASRLRATLDGVLDLAWVESAAAEFDRSPVDVLPVLTAAAEGYRTAAAEKGLGLEVCGDATVAVTNARALTQIVTALVDNAVRFTEAGRVVVWVWGAGPQVVVEVADTGIGMAEGFVTNAVEPFRQASQGDTRTHEGAGLGLALASRLVGLVGGQMDLTSTLGHGTTVRVRLPSVDAGASGDGASGARSASPTLLAPPLAGA